jgi:photosystem II stability/assembly factor-like uncharacterized protein
MAMVNRILPALFSICLSVPGSWAVEWREYGPPGGYITSLTSDSTSETLITTSQSHVYRSHDTGLFWERLPDLPGSDTARDSVVLDATQPVIIVCSDGGSVFRWNEELWSWESIENGVNPPTPPYGRQCYDLSIVSPTATRVFLGCSTGLHYSDTKGDLWTKIPLRTATDLPQRVEAAKDGSVYVNIGPTGTVYRVEPSYSEYTTFVCTPGLPCVSLNGGMIWPNPGDPDEILLVFPGYPPYYSQDRGENWMTPPGGVPSKADRAFWLYGDPAIVGVTATYSLDPGAMTWTTLWSRPVQSHYLVLPVGQTPGILLLGNPSRGIWRSSDYGQTWNYSSSGMHSSGQVLSVATLPNSASMAYVGVSQDGVWRTLDDGQTWEERNTGINPEIAYNLTVRSLAIDPANPNRLLAGLEPRGGDPAKVYQTTNGGGAWTVVPTAPTALAHKIHFVRNAPGVVLIGTLGDGVWRSVNNGSNWNKMPEFPQYSNINDIAEEAGGRLFACQAATFNTQGGIFVSTNSGASWTFSEAVGGLRSLAADRSQTGRLLGGFAGGGMVFSSNNGVSWNPVNQGLDMSYGGYGDSMSTVADPSRPGRYYTSNFGTGIYGTEDEGQHWTRLASHNSDFDAGGVLAFTNRRLGTLFAAVEGLFYAQLHQEPPVLTPTPTRTETSGPTALVTPTFTPPPGFPPHPTPTPTLPNSLNAGVVSELLWASPSSPTTGQTVTVGTVLFNNSTTNLNNVQLDFYWRSDTSPRTHLTTIQVPSLPARSRLETPNGGSFVPPSPGTYYVEAVVDEPGQFAESDESDNSATISFYARLAGADSTPPVGSLQVQGGSLFTQNYEVSLNLNATDTGSGVGYMWVTGWIVDPFGGDLYPYYDSGWIPYTSHATFLLSVISRGDIDAISVNYADLDENISDTYWGVVNYFPVDFPEYVWWDEVAYYPMYLPAGANVNVTVQHDFGDADLYILAPSTPDGFFQWSSVHNGNTSENVSLTTFEEGVHWVLVYGYDFSAYWLLCSGSGSLKAAPPPQPPSRPKDRRAPDLINDWNSGLLPQNAYIPPVGLDLFEDGMVDYRDLLYLSLKWGKAPGQPGYDARCGSADPSRSIGSGHLLQWLGLER